MRRMLIALLLISGMCITGCQTTLNENVNDNSVIVSGDYTAYIKGDDWGCGINKIVILLDKEIDEVSKNTFKVEETKENFDWTKPQEGLIEVKSERTVEDAYVSDEFGNRIEGASNYITIEMNFSPEEGSYLLLSMDSPYNQYPELYELQVSVKEGQSLRSEGKEVLEFNIDPVIKNRITSADEFKTNSYESTDGTKYNYAYFTPEQQTDTLVVWLHGLCEGGIEKTDPYIACLGNEVPALIGDEFQEILNYSNILIPQCPTFWMDNTGDGQLVDGAIITDGTSVYTESLYELINYYKKETGSDKVVIAGCSNGGYMAMSLALEYGSDFDSYVLICEAMEDKYISDEKIEAIKDLPLYFIYSNDDPLVNPELHEIPTINRLKEADASNLHIATFDEIIDTTGRFYDNEGKPYNFGGHSSWIRFFNNEVNCDDCGINVWSWMAE